MPRPWADIDIEPRGAKLAFALAYKSMAMAMAVAPLTTKCSPINIALAGANPLDRKVDPILIAPSPIKIGPILKGMP
jgi:hypothetical protein